MDGEGTHRRSGTHYNAMADYDAFWKLTFTSIEGKNVLTIPGPLDDDGLWRAIGASSTHGRGSPIAYIFGMLRGATMIPDLKSIVVDGLRGYSLYNPEKGEYIGFSEFAIDGARMTVGGIHELMRKYWPGKDMPSICIVDDFGACDFNPKYWNSELRVWGNIDMDDIDEPELHRIHSMVNDPGFDPNERSVTRQLERIGELSIASVPVEQLVLARSTANAQTVINSQ